MLLACNSEFDNPVGDQTKYNSGRADLSHFVSLGDSLTAGYADAALYLHGQENSYPAILAAQFAKVGGGGFNQPLVSDNLGGLLFGGNTSAEFPNRLVLDAETESPEPISGTPSTEVFSPLGGSFNNVGVPGAKSFHLITPGYGNPSGVSAVPATANPYFARFASAPDTTMLSDAASQQPSIFVLWIGNNDVLSYATSGGTGVDRLGNLDPATYESEDITDPNLFANIYNQAVSALSAAGGSGVLVNIPDISAIPFFTTVPFNALPLDQATVDLLNANYAAYNSGLQAAFQGSVILEAELNKRTILFSAGQNAVVIEDEELSDLSGSGLPSIRQATADDLILLTTASKIGEAVSESNPLVWGVSAPLTDGDVLIPEEINLISTARLAFNASIKTISDSSDDLLFVDAAALLNEVQDGFSYGTGLINATYATGDAFSLDGIHLTARGYAVVSNEIIDTINTGFEANIPKVDPGAFSAVFFK
jgi:lysophospholipase L1-like esterase